MPPKPKFTREEIVAAALALVSERGMDALTSRDLAAQLGSSPRPIFTVFRNMEEVQQAVLQAAVEQYNTFAGQATCYPPAFKQVGMQMILFAIEEPKLFQLLFMTANQESRTFDDIFNALGEGALTCVEIIQRDYQITPQAAKALFRQVWIFTFGIGALCATKVCRFTPEEISELLTQCFRSSLLMIQSHVNRDIMQ